MKIQTLPSHPHPELRTIADLMKTPTTSSSPGYLIGVGDLVGQQPQLQQTLKRLYPGYQSTDRPYLVVSPDQTESLFSDPNLLGLLKAGVKEIATQVHPHGGLVVEGCYLVFKAFPLFKKSTSETGTVRLFKIADIAHDSWGVLGELNPAFKIPAHWDNGVNFAFHTGGAFIEGKVPDVNEIAGWSDANAALLSKAFKFANAALNPAPQYHRIQAMAIADVAGRK